MTKNICIDNKESSNSGNDYKPIHVYTHTKKVCVCAQIHLT